ncbi:hypothetical protein [Paracidovorax citrulli]|uniref:hypothetical protein n=1 Tax=Paracidovorax citrulli TaxID=80869 RepID=UPI000B04FE28|nr:hypothetical protein [Paracidovorax citrulli]
MRSFLLAGILALVVLPAMSAETLETDTFRLEMKGDWKKEPSSDAEQFTLTSRKKDVCLTVSTMKFKESGVDLERMTKKLQEVRLSVEEAAGKRFNRKIEIAEPLVTKAERGWHLQYFGKDNTGRKFRYFGIVVPGKLMNIYAESSSANFEQLDEVLQEIFKGLQF